MTSKRALEIAVANSLFGPQGHRGGKHGRPGALIQAMSEEIRSALCELTSDDARDVRVESWEIE